MRLVLCRTAPAAFTALLPPERDAAAWHAAVTAELARHLGAAFASVFAAPEAGPHGIEWIADGERAMAAAALPPASRAALMTALAAILGDIARLAASGDAPRLAAAWPSLRQIPDETFIYAVDGRPVLAAWGQRAASFADPLAALAPPAPPPGEPPPAAAPAVAEPVPPARQPAWPLLALFLAAALIIGALLPGVALNSVTCALPPGTAAAIAAADQALAQNAALSAQLAALDEQAAKQQAQCPGALPAQAWNSGNLGMLQGCWHLVSDMKMQHEQTGQIVDVSTWLICFNSDGSGNQSIKMSDGTACTGPLSAQFDEGHDLIMDEPSPCTGAEGYVYQGHWVCHRTSDSQASCERTDKNGPSDGIFQR